jgi:FkbM family methyltransferase
MSGPSLVPVGGGLDVYATSSIDANFLYREIFTFDGYGDPELGVKPFVVDVGANIGMFLLRTKLRHPDAEVLAFEPMPDLAECVRRNVAHHHLTDVTFHQLALGESTRRDVPFTYFPLLPSGSTRYPQRQEALKEVLARSFPPRTVQRMFRGREVRVDVERLSDRLGAPRPIQLLKIDTSGSELEVLSGLDAAHWDLVERIILDVQDVEGRVAAVRDALADRGLNPDVRPAKMADGDGLNFVIEGQRR